MSIINTISAIGNNNSVYPLLVRDCGIEVPVKVALTYKQNESDKTVAMLATRERLVDEYTTSAVWLGGIPLLERISNAVISKRGFNPEIGIKLLKDSPLQGIETNIQKFKDLTPEAIKDLEFLKNNKSKYMKLLGGKVFAETAIPIALMGFIIPKMVFAWTAKTKKEIAKRKELAAQKNSPSFCSLKYKTMDEFLARKSQNKDNSENNPSFKGNMIAKMAELSTVQKMAVTDGGYAAGRVITARNKNAAIDVGFKMLCMLYLNFMFPKTLAKFLDTTTGKLIKSNLNPDIKLFNDEEFIEAIKKNKLGLPKAKTEKELLDFVDKNPDNLFVQYANKYKKIKLMETASGRVVRDPRSYVDLPALMTFRDNISEIAQKAIASGDVSKFMKKAKYLKGANILANVGISSFLLAFALPKTQFAFRKAVIKNKLEPGIAD